MSPHTTTLAPGSHFDVTVHIVLDDFGNSGRAYRETAEEAADFNTVVDDLMTGQFNNPIRVIAFNISEGWSRDVSDQVGRELLKRLAKEDEPRGARHDALLSFISAKRKCCALGSQTRK